MFEVESGTIAKQVKDVVKRLDLLSETVAAPGERPTVSLARLKRHAA
jgi:hypothetical protein